MRSIARKMSKTPIFDPGSSANYCASREAAFDYTAVCRTIDVWRIFPPIARLEARLPADLYAMLKRAAEIEGRTLSDFVVSAAREAASRTIAETEVLRLSVEDQKLFANAILHPPAPNAALRRMARRYRELFGA